MKFNYFINKICITEKGSGKYFPRITMAKSAESKQRDRVSQIYEADRWRYACENRGKIIVRVNTVSEVYNFARFIADAAYHTCAALSKANWRFVVEGNLLPTACKCPLWWGAGKPTGRGIVRYTRMTSSCFCCAKPLRRCANPHVFVTFSPKVTPAQCYKFGTSRTPSPTQCVQTISYLPNGRIIYAPTRLQHNTSSTVRPIQFFQPIFIPYSLTANAIYTAYPPAITASKTPVSISL